GGRADAIEGSRDRDALGAGDGTQVGRTHAAGSPRDCNSQVGHPPSPALSSGYTEATRSPPAISARMAPAAAAGSGAAVMGRPTTRCEAPAASAWAGVITRFWSPRAPPAGRT